MARQTPETMLISAMVNTADPRAGANYGITEEHFNGHRQVYEWVQQYYKDFNKMPTAEHLTTTFPIFPFNPEESDPRFPASQVSQEHLARKAKLKITEATQLLQDDKTKDAYEVLGELRYTGYANRPISMLNDSTYFEDYEAPNKVSTRTPWATLNNWTGGAKSGQLWYFAGRMTQGKSWSLVNVAAEAVRQGQRVIYYSLEMEREQLLPRFHGVMGHALGWDQEIDVFAMSERRYPLPKYRQLVAEINEHYGSGAMDIYDPKISGSVSPLTISAHASEYDMVIVDHIGLMRTEGGGRSVDDWRMAAANSNAMKEIALAHQVRVVSAVQLSKDAVRGARNYWQAPSMDTISQSDFLAMDADVVVTMSRMGRSAMTYSLEKNRGGQDKKTWFSEFDAKTASFDEIGKERAEVLRDKDDAEANG